MTVAAEFDEDSGWRGVAVQSDGKIVVAGFGTSNFDFILARYTSAGSLDSGFGTGGIVTTDILGDDNGCNALALQSDGKIVVTGYAYDGAKYVFATARYNSDGTLDSGFGSGGIVTTAFFYIRREGKSNCHSVGWKNTCCRQWDRLKL